MLSLLFPDVVVAQRKPETMVTMAAFIDWEREGSWEWILGKHDYGDLYHFYA